MSRKAKKRSKKKQSNPANDAFQAAVNLLAAEPMFRALFNRATIVRWHDNHCPPQGWAVVTTNGDIHVHPTRRADPKEWLYVLAHCLLHLAFDHFGEAHKDPVLWNVACDCFVTRFLSHLKLGRVPQEMLGSVSFSASSEEELYRQFCENGLPPQFGELSTAGARVRDMRFEPVRESYWYSQPPDWQKLFAHGVTLAVSHVVRQAANVEIDQTGQPKERTRGEKARQWFISTYPLLGALAASFRLIEDPKLCARMDIAVAAVNAELKEIYLNPAAGLDIEECRFVLAHEMLHVGLHHHARRQGRDPFLWNVACDYVINAWLIEMKIGQMPHIGALYDPELKGLSAESIYDHIVTHIRYYAKRATLRGVGLGDILEGSRPNWWEIGAGMDLDEFYRRCLAQGLEYHQAEERGFLPAGLVEEIQALSQPPIAWDVELARWFDEHFEPLEKRRTYARPSRRQASTPNIPRPRWVVASDTQEGRTFGVILDTSGSMDRNLLAKALGTIASYSISRDVPLERVVFCDAIHYDQGYMPCEAIANRVQVRGRGGTILQPAIDLLEKAPNFPKDGPLLIITDGYCDRLRIRREHAFLLPQGRHLPFVPRGKVFYIKD